MLIKYWGLIITIIIMSSLGMCTQYYKKKKKKQLLWYDFSHICETNFIIYYIILNYNKYDKIFILFKYLMI